MSNISQDKLEERILDRKTGYENYSKVRQEKGYLNDAQVAAIAGIDKSTLSNWKNGKSAPKVEKLMKIAKALKVNIKRLVV